MLFPFNICSNQSAQLEQRSCMYSVKCKPLMVHVQFAQRACLSQSLTSWIAAQTKDAVIEVEQPHTGIFISTFSLVIINNNIKTKYTIEKRDLNWLTLTSRLSVKSFINLNLTNYSNSLIWWNIVVISVCKWLWTCC